MVSAGSASNPSVFVLQELLNGFSGKEKRQMDRKMKTQLEAF